MSYNSCFSEVIKSCANVPRPGQDGAWLTDEMQDAYKNMHELGWAHSIEVWESDLLVGGLYGIGMGKVFFGESMFSKKPNASKIALHSLCKKMNDIGGQLIDCQVYTAHLASLGATEIPREKFLDILSNSQLEKFLKF